MAAETQKETEEKLNGASDVKEVGYKAFLKVDEGCVDEGAENANSEELMEVEEEIAEKEAEES